MSFQVLCWYYAYTNPIKFIHLYFSNSWLTWIQICLFIYLFLFLFCFFPSRIWQHECIWLCNRETSPSWRYPWKNISHRTGNWFMLHFLFVVPILNSGIHVKRAQHRKLSDTCSTIFHSMINEINSQSGCFPIHVHCTILIVALKWQLDKINVLWARAWPNNGLEGGMLTVSITQSFIFSCLCIFCFVLCFKYHFFF